MGEQYRKSNIHLPNPKRIVQHNFQMDPNHKHEYDKQEENRLPEQEPVHLPQFLEQAEVFAIQRHGRCISAKHNTRGDASPPL